MFLNFTGEHMWDLLTVLAVDQQVARFFCHVLHVLHCRQGRLLCKVQEADLDGPNMASKGGQRERQPW